MPLQFDAIAVQICSPHIILKNSENFFYYFKINFDSMKIEYQKKLDFTSFNVTTFKISQQFGELINNFEQDSEASENFKADFNP